MPAATSTGAPSAFDLAAPLPQGVTVLEASAGTGKTYAIAGLVARYVAEGTPLPRLLVVTFTRAATAELRDRVRSRLVGAAGHLEAVLAGASRTTDDRVLAVLGDGGADALRCRLERLETALGEFDAATVATIHGFCNQVLAGVGLAGDVDRAPTLVERDDDIVEAVVDDLLVRTFHARDGRSVLARRDLAAIAKAVVGNPDARIEPAAGDVPAGAPPERALVAVRAELAAAVREEVDRRKRRLGVLSYDDVLVRLADALADPVHGQAARRRLRAKYDVALIDEFQDTDPVQWRIVADAFGGGDGTLVLIGDPKQAIYSFRGADVHAYLQARREAAVEHTLGVNWRSDGPLLHAFNLLFDQAALGHAEIAYRPVEPAPDHREPRLEGAPSTVPLRLRVVGRDAGVRHSGKLLVAGAAREHIAGDLAAEVVALLSSEAVLVRRDAAGQAIREQVAPPHIAVLVRSNSEATLVQRTLRQAGVPAVINGVGSVFSTVGAAEWLRLLEALERPGSRSRAAAAALTAFVGWTAADVADAGDHRWDALHEQLHRWAGVLRAGSVAALWRHISASQGLPAQLLRRLGGERHLTDLDHVGELLHAAVVADELGSAALSGWLRERMAEAEEDLNPEERSRRLESDADAVQVLTIHRSKGLEFPIVHVPFLWSCNTQPDPVPVVHVDGDRPGSRGGGRIVDVGGAGRDEGQHTPFKDHQRDADKERRGEDVRLLYVALTRAAHQVVAWWAPTRNGEQSPLGRMLFCRSPRGGVRTEASCRIPDDETTLRRLGELAAASSGTIAVEPTAALAAVPSWGGTPAGEPDLGVAAFHRDIDLAWRRTSYSRMTALASAATAGSPAAPLVASEPEERVVDDEALAEEGSAQPARPGTDEEALRAVGSPLADLPGGVDIGTFVHAVLEHTDFTAEDLAGELRRRVTAQLDRQRLHVGSLDAVVSGLEQVVRTPLGPLAAGRSLRDVAGADRLDELEFELPLPGGPDGRGGPDGPGGGPDDPGGGPGDRRGVDVAAIGALLAAHLPSDDPLAGYPAMLADPSFRRSLRGFLTGSIDLVLRVRGAGPGGADRFVVVDHKTNRLGERGQPLTAWDYRPEALAGAMARGHYPLQALLYQVALHRYLRWRLPGYDPAAALGGVLYLFVRGMAGPATPVVDGQPCGVFAWQPPVALVEGLSDLLDRGAAPGKEAA